MKTLFAGVLGAAVILCSLPAVGWPQSTCPAELDQAKDMLSRKRASVKPEDVQAPRAMAGARQNVGAARGNQDVQAPRGNQDVQAPRYNEGVQAPRGNQDVQAPRAKAGARSQAQAAPSSLTKAASLVKESEAACKAGNMALASKKAKSAMALLE